MNIDFDGTRFLIRCEIWANDVVRLLPDRRWSKKERAWAAPLLRQNAVKIKEIIAMHGVTTTPKAHEALAEYMKKQERAVVTGDGFPVWYKFNRPPRKHQMNALNKKWGKKAFAMHADRGTGKTFVEISYACALRMEGKIDAVLVCVKLSGRNVWKEELAIDATIPYDLCLPYTDDIKGFERWVTRKHDFKWMVVGLESLSEGRMHQLVEKFLLLNQRVLMIIDESHLIIGHKSIRTKRCIDFGKKSAYRDTSTGTPISTGPLNLFTQFEFLDPDIIGIGDFYAFRNRYAVILEKQTKAGQKYPLIIGYQNIDELTKLVAPYVFEVRKCDVLDLPPKIYEKAYVQLSREQREAYDKIRKEKSYLIKGKEEVVIKNVLELMLRLHTVCGGFLTTYTENITLDRSGNEKIKRMPHWHPVVPVARNPKIIELLDWTDDNKQCIIWAAYRVEIAAIVEALSNRYPKETVREIHGGISESDRAAFRHEFQRGKVKYIVGNTATGGSSDTWTACETMVYYNNTEKMIDREQSEDRAHRDGLKHSVLYVDLIAERTVDVSIMKSVQTKVNLSEYIRQNIRDVDKLLDGMV